MSHNVPVIAETISATKKPNSTVKVGSSYPLSPSWRFSRADYEHDKWSVLDSRDDVVEDPTDVSGTKILHTFSKSIDPELLESLKARESTTWSDLLTQTGGRSRGTNSHHIPIAELIKPAQERLTELGIVEDELLSLRLNGTCRVFGMLEEGVLSIVWFDRCHEICPATKK